MCVIWQSSWDYGTLASAFNQTCVASEPNVSLNDLRMSCSPTLALLGPRLAPGHHRSGLRLHGRCVAGSSCRGPCHLQLRSLEPLHAWSAHSSARRALLGFWIYASDISRSTHACNQHHLTALEAERFLEAHGHAEEGEKAAANGAAKAAVEAKKEPALVAA